MAHGYSLRSTAKGRRGHQSSQVEGSSDGTISSTGHDLTDDPGPAAPEAAAHNAPVPTQRSAHQTTEEERRSRGIPSTILGNTTHLDPRKFASRTRRLESSEEIRKGRAREEERRRAEAGRIRREQLDLGFKRDVDALRARIEALRRERDAEVVRVKRRWKRAREIEQGGAAVAEEDGEVVEEGDSEEADGEMEVEDDYAQTEVSFTANDDEDGRWQQQRWPSPPPPRWSHHSETPTLQTGSRQTQQPPRIEERFSSSGMVGPSQLEEESEEARQSQGRVSQSRPQPLRRQRAQLVMLPNPTTDSEMGE